MLKTVIWATDGSEYAERALPYAKALLDGDDALLVAVHIIDEPASAAASGAGSDDLVATLRGLVSGIAEKGLAATTRILNHIGQAPAHQSLTWHGRYTPTPSSSGHDAIRQQQG